MCVCVCVCVCVSVYTHKHTDTLTHCLLTSENFWQDRSHFIPADANHIGTGTDQNSMEDTGPDQHGMEYLQQAVARNATIQRPVPSGI